MGDNMRLGSAVISVFSEGQYIGVGVIPPGVDIIIIISLGGQISRSRLIIFSN